MTPDVLYQLSHTGLQDFKKEIIGAKEVFKIGIVDSSGGPELIIEYAKVENGVIKVTTKKFV